MCESMCECVDVGSLIYMHTYMSTHTYILRCLAQLGHADQRTSDGMYEIIALAMKVRVCVCVCVCVCVYGILVSIHIHTTLDFYFHSHTHTHQAADVGFNAGYAVLHECIRTITKIYPNKELLEQASQVCVCVYVCVCVCVSVQIVHMHSPTTLSNIHTHIHSPAPTHIHTHTHHTPHTHALFPSLSVREPLHRQRELQSQIHGSHLPGGHSAGGRFLCI
jgi:hypothetical protein